MRRDSKEFLALQDKWYKKLEKQGFDEIEQPNGMLKAWHSYTFMRQDDESVHAGPARQEYYRLAGQFLHDHDFDNAIEKKAWELHCDGLSIEDIAESIGRTPRKNKTFKKTVNKRNVHETLQRLAKEMLGKCRIAKE